VPRRALMLCAAMMMGTACGGHGDSHSAPALSIPVGADFNVADVEFAQGMIPHHEQAVELAEIALKPAANASPAVMDLATRVRAGQSPEVATMTSWLAEWKQPLEMSSGDGHDMASMEGMISVGDMAKLSTKTGAEFDSQWTTLMIRHHEGAIKMAETVATKGIDPDVKALAAVVIATQTAELAEMKIAVES
jgi:uncharacterized protein (DUF305 family)